MEEKKRKCKRCGHEWTLRFDEEPLSCPACKSYKWNVEKKKKVKQEKGW